MDILAEMSALGLFGTGLSQHARLVTLISAQDRGLPESLMAEQFTGREGVNELFAFEVDALSVSTDLDLSMFIGEELTISLLQPDGSRRSWHGLCAQAGWQGADGGVARYRLRLEPALSLLAHRRDSFIFQNKDAQEIISELLADYPQIRFEFDVSQQLPQRAVCTQYRESDLEFFTRLLAAEGLNYRFEHDQGADMASDGHAKHKLVIFDSAAPAPATMGGDTIRFHGVRATDTDDAIDHFAARRQVRANAVSISSWDPLQLLAPAAEQQSSLDAGELPVLPVYDGSRERRFDDRSVADERSRLMLQALELENKQFDGAGAVRRLAPGHAFTLSQHERYATEARFKVLWVEHAARNNIGTQIKSAQRTTLEPGTYRNSFVCVRDSVAIVPRAMAEPPARSVPGPQTALIVGTADAFATTNRDHCVKVQFAWQRGTAANPGGIAHNLDAAGNAPGDDRSGTWVRVAEALAGPNWGTQFVPRIGTEVLVDFVEGDIDRPLVVAQLYTGADLPPFSAGVDASANHIGTLSGFHSHNADGGGFNQWQLDDSTGQVRTRLATSTAHTQLNLGYLIKQEPGTAQRGGYRGSGFELRSDAWGVVRGGSGVLLSTTARMQVGSGISSTQMDATEAVSLMNGAVKLEERLAQAAAQQKALASSGAADAQRDFIARINPADKGKHAATVNGQEALKAAQGERTLDQAQPVEAFATPAVLMEGPSAINWASPASTTLYAGEHMQWSTQSDLHQAAAHTAASVAAQAAAFFSHGGGVQAVAASGPVSLHAHTDQLELLADQAVTVMSVNDSIQVQAQKKIVLQAGQSSITLEGGDITFTCPGNFTVKGGKHPFDSGASAKAALPSLPDSRLKLFDEAFLLKADDTGELLAFMPYRIRRADGSFETGITDDKGQTHLVRAAEAETIEVEHMPGPMEAPHFDEQIQFKNANDALLADVRYSLKLDDGSTVEGVTDEAGMTQRVISEQPVTIVEATLWSMPGQSPCCAAARPEPTAITMSVSGVATNDIAVGNSVVEVKTPAGKARPLTAGEIAKARTIFGNAIDYTKVKVHNGEYLWFGLQPDNTAMTPNGEMYFNPTRFKEDFSVGRFSDQIWFMHEMVHVWQYQLGYPVKARGAIRLGLDYEYTLAENKLLSDYNMEAQGDVLADYWALKTYGAAVEFLNAQHHVNDLRLYEKVLRKFIANPADKSNLPGG